MQSSEQYKAFAVFKKFKKWDWKMLLICILIATFAWIFTALNKQYTSRIDYPVRFTFGQTNVVAVNPPPNTVEIDVTGQGWILLQKELGLDMQPMTIRLSRPEDIKFMTSKALLPRLTENLPGLKINRIIKDTIFFEYNRITVKQVLVLANSSRFGLAEGYRISSPVKVEPAQIRLKGAESLIRTTPDTLYVILKEEDIDEDFSAKTAVNLPEHPLLVAKPDRVLLSFEVEQFESKSVDLPVNRLNFPADSSVYIFEDFVTLNYTFPVGKPVVFSTDSVQVFLDLEKMSPADSTVVPEIQFSGKILTGFSVAPSQIKIHFRELKNRNNRRNRRR